MKRLFISVAAILLVLSCNKQNTQVASKESDEKIPVKAVRTELYEYTPTIELSGTAFADREANLGAALPGRVEKIYYGEGSNVRKGDLLVSLSGELYTQALVEYTAIEKDYERVTRLNEKGSISTQDYDHVKAMYDASKAKVEMMKKNAEIVAPFPGVIASILVQEGENYFFNLNLDPGYSTTSGILRLMKIDPIQVEVEVNEKEFGRLKNGQKAQLSFDAIGDSTFHGRISSIKPMLSTLTHTTTVRVEVENRSGVIKPGMFSHVKIEFTPVKGVSVPQNAVYKQPGIADDFVFIVDNNKVKKQKVEKLWTNETTVGISGVKPGVTVVTNGKEKLQDGSLVEIR
jgi:membrane fusion protein, multidrug efflux system